MTKEEKQLLFKDLCARLPYHPITQIYNDSWDGCRKGEFDNMLGFHHIEAFLCDRIEILPYLRPISSMTEEEKKELLRTIVGKKAVKYFQVLPDGSIVNTDAEVQDLNDFTMHWINFNKDTITSYIDWLNKHHFNYRLPDNLYIVASEGMYMEEQ